MSTDRDSIPDPIKTQLRQDAGFGCCRCGSPFVQYHHILGVGNTGDDPQHMMALCPNCHHLATTNALSPNEQYRLKNKPLNRKQGLARGQLFTTGAEIVVQAGNNLFFGEGFKLVVDNEPLVAIARSPEGALLLSLRLYDEGDRLLLDIDDNEWKSESPELWDLDAKPRQLRIRAKFRDVRLAIDARGRALKVTAELFRKGQRISVTNESLLLATQRFRFIGFGFLNCGIRLNSDDNGGTIAWSPAGEGSMYALSGPPSDRIIDEGLAELRKRL